MAAFDHSGQVLAHLRLSGPSRAREIAAALGVDRALVNNALYGPLGGKVTQGRNYKWALADAPEIPQAAGGQAKNSRASLFAYYLDCLSQDDDSGVRTFADSRFALDYVELEAWPLEPARPDFATDPLRKLLGRQRREARKKALWLGYPALVRQVRGRNGWEGTFLEPLLIWPQDPDAHELAFLPEPLLNTRALEGLTASENVLEEAASLADELGLDDSEPPPLDELVARLRALRPEWDWKDELAPAKFRGPGELRTITGKGIYNAAIVVMADRSPFTLGLERELSALQTVADALIGASSLRTLLRSSVRPEQFIEQIAEPRLEHVEPGVGDRHGVGPIVRDGPRLNIVPGRPADASLGSGSM